MEIQGAGMAGVKKFQFIQKPCGSGVSGGVAMLKVPRPCFSRLFFETGEAASETIQGAESGGGVAG